MMIPTLSVKQPGASLIAQGKKTIETRLWGTAYRGPLVICSSREPRDQGPVGRALCIVMVKSCRPMTEADEAAARCEIYERAIAWHFGKMWPVMPFAMRGQRGIFPLSVPEYVFVTPEDRQEVHEALEWSRRNGLLKYIKEK